MPKIKHTCSSFGCKNKVEFWITKKRFLIWYGLCREHLNQIIEREKKNLDRLFPERIRRLNLKIQFQKKDKEHPVNWKMFLDWEELGYHSKIKCWDKAYGDIKITMALQEHQRENLEKYIKKMEKEKNMA